MRRIRLLIDAAIAAERETHWAMRDADAAPAAYRAANGGCAGAAAAAAIGRVFVEKAADAAARYRSRATHHLVATNAGGTERAMPLLFHARLETDAAMDG